MYADGLSRLPIINIQEVHQMYAGGLHLPIPNSVRPPYDECVLVYKPFEHITNLTVVRCADNILDFVSYASVRNGEFTAFLDVSMPLVPLGERGMTSGRSRISSHPDMPDIANATCAKVLFALGLMNCQNVSYVDMDPNDSLRPRERRARSRSKKQPYLTYKILEIQPLKKRSYPVDPTSVHETAENPLHSVRGHFKTFTEDRPLFGRIVGTFWWGPCLKGNPEIGIVEKDYHLKIDRDSLAHLVANSSDTGWGE